MLFKVIYKLLLVVLTILAAYFGVSVCESCSVSRDFNHHGTGVFHYSDTMRINGTSSFSKNFPYGL